MFSIFQYRPTRFFLLKKSQKIPLFKVEFYRVTRFSFSFFTDKNGHLDPQQTK
ncbi:hypothetical protein LEP1GSC046_3383 [Leptospira kirschneri serovar Bim str. 1051]|nr:hypothetical protein LEP1GSC042_3339 [Leptospira kirschneri serovar Bim str. PUO 1247]EMN05125.1 hypothetical protein LEP1GSC046_3383 [Leptospira kirschneri serovar Bim str. 1051]